MVYCKVVLACALVAVVASQPFAMDFGSALSGAAGGLLGFANKTVHNAHKAQNNGANQGVQEGTGVPQQGAPGASPDLGSAAADVLKHGVDVGTNMAAQIPGLGGIASIGGDLAKKGVDELVSGILTSSGTGLVASGIALGVPLASALLKTGLGLAGVY